MDLKKLVREGVNWIHLDQNGKWTRSRTFGFHKTRGISWPYDYWLPKKRLCSMELINTESIVIFIWIWIYTSFRIMSLRCRVHILGGRRRRMLTQVIGGWCSGDWKTFGNSSPVTICELPSFHLFQLIRTELTFH